MPRGTMANRHVSYALVVAAVFAVALAMRTIPLYWSPLPSTLDSFAYAGVANDVLATGRYPASPDLRADFFVLTLLTAAASELTGEQPVYVIQPLVSVIGTAVVLVGVALTRRLGTDLGWPARRVRLAALATGLLLAVQGLFLRRTTVPDPEVLGILLALLAVVALHRVLWHHDDRWLAPFAVILVTFPLLHIFSSFNAAVMLTSLYALALAARPSRRTLLLGGGLVLAFWAVFTGYYQLVQYYEIYSVSYTDRISSHPGLFVAWLVAMAVGAAWYQRAGARLQRVVFVAPIAAGFVVVVVNVVRPIFPGTVQSPPAVTVLLSFLVVPVLFAGYAAPALAARYDHSAVVVAMLAGPVVVVYFSLSASLTPDYFGTVMRAQTFAHVPAFVLVGLAAVSVLRIRGAIGRRWRAARVVALAALFAATLLTVPVAFVTLDTFHYPATTAESEFAAAGFASTKVPGSWTTHHPPDQIASQYFEGGGHRWTAREWLAGGERPGCPVLSQDSWTTHGAHFFPAAPLTIARGDYDAFLADRNVVYASTGRDPLVLSRPRDTEADVTCDRATDENQVPAI